MIRFSDHLAKLFRSPWFAPLLLLVVFGSLRVFLPETAVKPERVWLDQAFQVRDGLGYSQPLDTSIRFVELKMNDEIARRFGTIGEYETAAGILKTLAKLKVKVIALDIIYSFGLEEDQELLADTIREIEAAGQTSVVVPLAIEKNLDPPTLSRSLPAADGDQFATGVVNAIAADRWRQYEMVHEFEGTTYPSLALAALSASRPSMLGAKAIAPGVMTWKSLGEDGKAVTESADRTPVFLNLQHSYFDDEVDKENGIAERRVWSIADLEEAAAREGGDNQLIDTIVFLGYDVELDGKPTAHGNLQPGMYLHGTALNDLLQKTSITKTCQWIDLGILGIVALVTVVSFYRIRRKRWLFALAIGGALLLLALGWFAILSLHLLPAAVLAATFWGTTMITETGRRWGAEQRERTQRDAMLGFYFSPAVLKQVTQDLDMIRPQGTDFAVLLSDLRGFTTLCETQPVERVFELLNRLFGAQTDAALRENGSLARFAGDQFLAYWGAPEPCQNAPDRALRAALEIQRTLEARRLAAPEGDLDEWLHIGVGLHYGRALVGHVGSRSYRDYNIVGDAVNTTARVEGQTKNYAAPVLATGEFIEALSTKPDSILVDCVRVKGKANPTELHAFVLESSPEKSVSAERYEDAFSVYRSGDFGAAQELFEALENDPFDTVSVSAALLATRCRELLATTPEAWDGAYELRSK